MRSIVLISFIAVLLLVSACRLNDAGSGNNEPRGGLSGDYAADSKGAANSQENRVPVSDGSSKEEAVGSGNEIDSVYTQLGESHCRTIEANQEGEWSVQECKGVSGYRLELMEGDLRQTINIVAPNGKRYELNFWSVVSSAFSYLGDKAEWRGKMVDGKLVPFALIVRYNVSENPDIPSKSTSYLTVSKITANSICVTDVVKPMKNANNEARRLALLAADKPCLKSR